MGKQARTEFMFRSVSSAKTADELDASPILPWHLRRDIILLLLIKAAILTLLYFLFFGPAERAPQTAEAISTHIFSTAVQPDSPR